MRTTLWTGYLTSTYLIRDRKRGIDGEFLEVFVTRKDPDNKVKLQAGSAVVTAPTGGPGTGKPMPRPDP